MYFIKEDMKTTKEIQDELKRHHDEVIKPLMDSELVGDANVIFGKAEAYGYSTALLWVLNIDK